MLMSTMELPVLELNEGGDERGCIASKCTSGRTDASVAVLSR